MVVARTRRLLIRSWTAADAPALLAIYSDPLVTQHIPHVALKDLAGAEAKVRQMQELEEQIGCTLWAVEQGGELIGVCGFRSPEELGFAFRRDAWGQGIAVEAASACIDWASNRGVRRIVAATRPANAGSRRVLDKLGFRACGEKDGWLIYERLTATTSL